MKRKDSGNTIQAMWVGLGSLSSFLFSIISAAILSRFLIKSDYGTYRQVMYVYHTMLVVFTLGLPKAYGYFLPRVKLEEGNHVVNKLNICFMLMGGLFSLILFFSSPIIASILKNPDLEESIKIFSPAPLFLLPTMGLEGTMSSYRMTRYGTIYMISTRVFMLLCVALPVALYKADVNVALWGFTVSSFLSCLLALYIKKIPFRKVENVKSTLTYKQIFAFSLPLMTATLWAVAIKSADQFFVSRWFGQEVFADFSNGSLELPFVQMVLGAGGVVLLPLFSRYVSEGNNKQELIDLWMRVSEKAALILYPLIVYCWAFAPLIMTFLYGDQYSTSAIYFRIMLVVNFFTIAQYYPIILALGATKYYAKVHMASAFLVWILEFICVLTIPSPYAITAVSVFCHLVKIYLMVRFISSYFCIKPWNLFPLKALGIIFLTCSVAAAIVVTANEYIICINQKFISLCVTFTLFASLAYVFGRVFSINYLVVVEPIINKLRR